MKAGGEATVRRKGLQVKLEELQERIRKTKILINCVKKVRWCATVLLCVLFLKLILMIVSFLLMFCFRWCCCFLLCLG